MTGQQGPAGPARGQAGLSAAEFRELYQRLRQHASWGPADRRGALNYITTAEILAAVGEVRLGVSATLAAPVATGVTPDNPDPGTHQMTHTADDAGPAGLAFATDRLAMNVHGNVDSHLDALCHIMYDGVLYNGVPAGTVTADGARELSVEVAKDGIVGRGVLLDIPRLRGLSWLEPGEHVTRRRSNSWPSGRSRCSAVTATATPRPAASRAKTSLCTCSRSTHSACTCWTICSSVT